MNYSIINYKDHVIKQRIDVQSHCASIEKAGNHVKMIAGDIDKEGNTNVMQKAMQFIDSIK